MMGHKLLVMMLGSFDDSNGLRDTNGNMHRDALWAKAGCGVLVCRTGLSPKKNLSLPKVTERCCHQFCMLHLLASRKVGNSTA